MTGTSAEGRLRRVLKSYGIFFLLFGFVVTCCMSVFLITLQRTLGFAFTEENIRQAAVLTFGNVVFLTLLCTVVNGVRSEFTVERPVRKILAGMERVMNGDLSARIEPLPGFGSGVRFDLIAAYFNRMAEELGSLETLRTDFVANVSHELKTPLAVIQNYGTLLQSPDLSEAQRMEYAKAIIALSHRLADLITNILKLNRLESQQIYPAAQRFHLGEQLAECLLHFENIWEEKRIEIRTDLEEDVYVQSDPELLSLVWNNLFSNALKFTEPGGTVSVSLHTGGDGVTVRVADTGCGISPETGKHIFEKFYQGDTSHATQGNGLGLALVKRVVDIVGGQIDVHSQVGEGSVFTVKLAQAG